MGWIRFSGFDPFIQDNWWSNYGIQRFSTANTLEDRRCSGKSNLYVVTGFTLERVDNFYHPGRNGARAKHFNLCVTHGQSQTPIASLPLMIFDSSVDVD